MTKGCTVLQIVQFFKTNNTNNNDFPNSLKTISQNFLPQGEIFEFFHYTQSWENWHSVLLKFENKLDSYQSCYFNSVQHDKFNFNMNNF